MSKEFAEKMFSAFERERTSTDSGTEMIIRIRLPFADAADVDVMMKTLTELLLHAENIKKSE